jgi:16S rRNA C1402 N4-methylase RsmH
MFVIPDNIISFDQEKVEKLLHDRKWTPLFKKVIEPTDRECKENPRSRSSRLRAAIKN